MSEFRARGRRNFTWAVLLWLFLASAGCLVGAVVFLVVAASGR